MVEKVEPAGTLAFLLVFVFPQVALMHQVERNHGMDAIRAIALLAGIFLHATLSFLPGIRRVGLTVVDNSESITLSSLFFFIHMFRMPLFFVIAGYFAHMLVRRKGWRAFLSNRAWRMGVPLAVGLAICFPLTIVAVLWSAAKLHVTPTRPDIGNQPSALPFPLMHLWFLYALAQFYAVSAIVYYLHRWARHRFSHSPATSSKQTHTKTHTTATFDASQSHQHQPDPSHQTHEYAAATDTGDDCSTPTINQRVAKVIGSPPAAAIAGAVFGAALLSIPEWYFWFGVPTPDRSLITHPITFFIYLNYYWFGWAIFAHQHVLSAWQRQAWLYLSLGLGCYCACISLVGVEPQLRPIAYDVRHLLYTFCYCVGQWCLMAASMGFGLRWFHRPSRLLRYLSDASYWMYLVHMPIVLLLQTLLMDWSLHWSIKYTLILLLTHLVLIASYHTLIRNTKTGKWIMGGGGSGGSSGGGSSHPSSDSTVRPNLDVRPAEISRIPLG